MIKTIQYPAIFHKDDDGCWVEFPDLSGCNTWGNSFEIVVERVKEALEAYTMALLEDGIQLPQPSDLYEIQNKYQDNPSVIIQMISASFDVD